MLTLGQAGLVLLGGALGSAARYGAMRLATKFELHASSALVAINLVGCFLAGATAQMFVGGAPGIETDVAKFLVLGGVLGGFTTFSAVALECATAAGPRRRRIFINAAVSVILAAPLARLGMIVVGGGS